MGNVLIIIRGNSGSGKSTIATKLRLKMGYTTMLVPQDVVRRDMLRVSDEPGNPAVQLIAQIAQYGKQLEYNVIVEGILAKAKYGGMLTELSKTFETTLSYYFDVSFEETLKRHQLKEKRDEFGAHEMKSWWIEKDYLGLPGEYMINADMSENEIVELIYNHVQQCIIKQ